MSGISVKLLNMSIAAGWIVAVIILLRIVFKKGPKWARCLLWAVAALRLLLPVSLESSLSVLPSARTVVVNEYHEEDASERQEGIIVQIESGIPAVDRRIEPVIGSLRSGDQSTGGNKAAELLDICGYIWAAGVLLMTGYAAFSYIRLLRLTKAGIRRPDGIYICDRTDQPFILGIVRPRVILPSGNMPGEQHVIAHEKAHLSRRDYLWKPLGWLLLTVYWFNPLMWAAYILFCRDIELACDEKAVKDMTGSARADYSRTLLSLGSVRRAVSACPLAFGETAVKDRIKTILNYKRPAFWVVAAAIIVCIALAVCFLTDRPEKIPQQGEISEWFDMYDMYHGREEFDPVYPEDYTTDAFPGARFVFLGEPGCLHVAEKDGNIKRLNYGTPLNAWLCDLTGDGKPELCVTFESGSGHTIEHIIVYDYAEDKLYWFIEPDFDLALKYSNGKLVAEKRIHIGAPGRGPLVARGLIMIKNGALTLENGEKTEVEDFVTAQGYDFGYTGYDLEMHPGYSVLITDGRGGERYISLYGGYIYIGHSGDGRTVYKEYVPFRPNDSEGKNMRLDDVFELAKKGEALSLEDLKGYAFSEIGSGVNVRLYTLSTLFDTSYYLAVSELDDVIAASLVYIPTGDSIDIRKEDPRAFWERHREPQIEDVSEEGSAD